MINMSRLIVISMLLVCEGFGSLQASPLNGSAFEPVKVIQLVSRDSKNRQYTRSLTTLLNEISSRTSVQLDTQPVEIDSLLDEALSQHAMLYINVDSFTTWKLSAEEQAALKKFIELGGFVYLDAGIKTEFLLSNTSAVHSFADWRVRPLVDEMFAAMFPDKRFEPLPRNHPLFHAVYSGLPDAQELPDAIKDFVVNEKWPGGTYSLMGLMIDNRLAVVASPIVAIGWGRDETGNWIYQIEFRVREGSDELSQRLGLAAFSGNKFNANRADGLVDIIFTQKDSRPGWVQEPNGSRRAFRYYNGKEISDFAHFFYTRLGINIFVYSLLN